MENESKQEAGKVISIGQRVSVSSGHPGAVPDPKPSQSVEVHYPIHCRAGERDSETM